MKICPRCGKRFKRLLSVSRMDNKTMICDECGTTEALQDALDRWEMKTQNRIVESLCQVDFSELAFPMVTIYERPLDFPDAFVARIWDGKGARPTNTMIKKLTIQEIREDIRAAGFMTVFHRAEDDDPHIVETWM